MTQLDWSEFKTRIALKASKETILDYWSSQDNLEKWFLSLAQFYTPDGATKERLDQMASGDRYKWMWHGSDIVTEGEVIEVNNAVIKFTFVGCIVSVSVNEDRGEQILELVQSEIALDDTSRMNNYVGCTRGWTFYMTNLKSILEGGIDLRNRNIELVDVINT